jgi:glycosyltransferase involved in cell wall biosynthesis
MPMYADLDKPLLPSGPLPRLTRAISRRLLSQSPRYFQKEAVKDYLRRNKVNAVLAEYGQTGVAVMSACVETDIPLVVHFHGFDAFDQRVLDVFGKYYLLMFERVSAIVAASQSMRDRLIELGAPSKKIFVNPYGVDMSLFSDANPESSSPVFVSVGRFVDKKAPHLTLLSFKSVLEQCSDARLIMVGDGELLEACKLMAKALEITSSVQFLGVCSPSEIAVILRSARALVQHSISTSYGDSESLGVVFLEAGASGLPVIATRHDGIPEVVIDGETGFLVREGDIKAMAKHMIALAKDPILAAQLGKAARERMHTEFYMEKSINNLWNIIEKVIQ